ncbi:MAG: 4-hydroxy-tetrahydrodipicolinate reductase [Aureispira sp.]|nr:4-hydroxy-tetrahydrodipicolinate reductase [Aureispira sp.]
MKIAIIGYGKMGKTIERLATNKGDEIVLKITSQNTNELTIDNLQKADVAIEFTRPEMAFDNIKLCLEAGIPVVSGTTAWMDQYDEAATLCTKHKGGLFVASNFSIGVNVFFAANAYVAKLMNQYDGYRVDMEEVHHTQKLDAPSGTAITLANKITNNLDRMNGWHLKGDGADHPKNSIPITAKRIDKVPGTHVVRYESGIDELSFSHVAHGREGFASGAIMAARWMIGKEGCFGMTDLLGI